MSNDETPKPDEPVAANEPGQSRAPKKVGASGNEAVEKAAERARVTADRNVTPFGELPIARDTANLREGPDLHPGLLALLPLVGVWEGEGEADTKTHGEHRFGQQIIVTHDGENYLSWSSRSWTIGEDGAADIPAYRESGFWRISNDDEIEFLIVHASGVIEAYYGKPLNQSSWRVSTDATMSTPTGPELGGAIRLYGLVENGDLGWVEERVHPEKGRVPTLSARLHRVAG